MSRHRAKAKPKAAEILLETGKVEGEIAEVTSKHMDQIDIYCGVMILYHIDF